MSGVKSALKAAKSAIDTQSWHEAVVAADQVLALDAQNYHAYVLPSLAIDSPTVLAGLADRSTFLAISSVALLYTSRPSTRILSGPMRRLQRSRAMMHWHGKA